MPDGVMHGNVWMIWNRWHDLGRPGTYLVIFMWNARWARNTTAIVDDFGNLQPVDLKW